MVTPEAIYNFSIYYCKYNNNGETFITLFVLDFNQILSLLGFKSIALNPNLNTMALNTRPFSGFWKIQKYFECNPCFYKSKPHIQVFLSTILFN